MLTPQELKKSPLFQDIGYENYQQMLDCCQAVQRSYRVDEVIYDFSGPAGNAVGVVERGEASLIRIDEEGVATVLEELGPGGVFGKSLAFSDKAQALSERVDVLSRRSIREKLLCYFNQLAEKEGSRTFQLPFSLSMLADYIATDRSAMMRELKRLKEEGVLRSEGRRITLCTG